MSRQIKRARTSSQKAERRLSIIIGAEKLLRESGVDNFSMGALAKEVGIARGTLYIYFETREELLLNLHMEQLQVWSTKLIESLENGMQEERFLRVFKDVYLQDPLLNQLLSRLGDVIEQNVSLERVIESKRFLRDVIEELTGKIGKCLGLGLEDASDLLISLLVLLAGIIQFDNRPDIDPKLLPEDLQEMAQITSDRVYMKSGQLIMAGVRAEGGDGT